MKNLLYFLMLIGPLAICAWDCDECCDDEDEECCQSDYNEVDHSYLRDEADWPTKLDEPLLDSLKR